MSNQNQIEMKADTPVQVTLAAGQWSQVLGALNEMPRKMAQPLFEEINNTLIAAAQPISADGNGMQLKKAPDPDVETIEEALGVEKK